MIAVYEPAALTGTDRGERTSWIVSRDAPGQYEAREIIHTVRHHGQIVIVDHVPAEVCSICGDVLLTPDTVRHIEALLRDRPEPSRTIPLYEYA